MGNQDNFQNIFQLDDPVRTTKIAHYAHMRRHS